MQQTKGAVLTLILIAGGLAGLGVWQFGGVGLGGGEHDEGDDDRHAGQAATPDFVQRLAAERGSRIVEVEQEREDGRAVYEVKLVDAEGRRQKLHVDAATGELLGR